MNLNVPKEVAALQRLSMKDLRTKFADLFGEPTRVGNRTWLVRRIAWRLQALAEGDMSERARQRAAELANDADLRLSPPRTPRPAPAPAVVLPPPPPRTPKDDHRLMPGTVLTRVYKGETLQVQVLAHGFEFEGSRYPSLSAVAKAITGAHWNGRLFFGLTDQGGAR
jgi:hypothetical protein